MAVTVRDVARQAGVSAMTVSNVLRGKAGTFGSATRDKVLAAAEELGYRGSALPTAMRSGVFDTVALIAGSNLAELWISGQMIDGIHDALDAHCKRLLYCKLLARHLTAVSDGELPAIMRETHADGVLINGQPDGFDHQVAKNLRHYPVVFLNGRHEYDSVYPDDVMAGRIAYDYLRDRGCRNIAYVTRFAASHHSMVDRMEGFLAAAGSEPVALFIPPAGERQTEQQLWEAEGARLMSSDVDGVFCYCQNEAHDLCLWAMQHGRSDLIITLVNERPYVFGASYLPTVTMPMRGIGQRGVEMLMRRIAGGPSQKAEVLPVSMVEPG